MIFHNLDLLIVEVGLAHYFLRRFSKETKKNFTEIKEEALEKLLAYDWPGNVRELANVMERAVVLGEGPRIDLADLPARIALVRPPLPGERASYREAVDAYRRELIVKALKQAEGNHAAAAKLLGLHRTHLFRLVKALRIG